MEKNRENREKDIFSILIVGPKFKVNIFLFHSFLILYIRSKNKLNSGPKNKSYLQNNNCTAIVKS